MVFECFSKTLTFLNANLLQNLPGGCVYRKS